MGKRRVLLRGLFVVGLVAVLCAYGLATEQAANKNQGAANQNQGAASQQSQTRSQPGVSQQRAPSSQTAQAMTLVRTSDLMGKDVKSTQGENLGAIHDIVLSPDYQQVSYVEQKSFSLKPGDQITITGSESKIRSRSVILVSELKKGDQTLPLRDKSGKPLWSMGGQSPSAGTSGNRSRQE